MNTSTMIRAVLMAALWLTFDSQLKTVFAQGSLTPPGAPAPTMKSLAQIEPRQPVGASTTPGDATTLFLITNAGSYYLTGNITGVTNKHGITINASGVTLDLMGFELAGVANSQEGIHIGYPTTNIVVRNGTVRDWGQTGVNGDSAFNCHYENLRISRNAFYGLNCGPNGTVLNCVVQDTRVYQLNGGTGIAVDLGCTVRGCSAYKNAERGFSVYESSTITDCTATYNGTAGIFLYSGSVANSCTAAYNSAQGFYGGAGTALNNCTAYRNANEGIYAFGARLVGCASYGNTFDGFQCPHSALASCLAYANGQYGINGNDGVNAGREGVTLDHCNVYQNTFGGIRAGDGSTIMACTAYLNTSNGISAGNGSSIIACAARTNWLDGIVAGFGCTIRDCNATDNRDDGIQVTSGSFLSGNNCYNNGPGTNDGAGIHVIGNNNRLDQNTVALCDRGLEVSGIDNLIVRNSASFCTTNYLVGSGNKVGVIAAAPSSGAISGSTGGAGVGTTDPWANLSFP